MHAAVRWLLGNSDGGDDHTMPTSFGGRDAKLSSANNDGGTVSDGGENDGHGKAE
jgi:hypothetical protein